MSTRSIDDAQNQGILAQKIHFVHRRIYGSFYRLSPSRKSLEIEFNLSKNFSRNVDQKLLIVITVLKRSIKIVNSVNRKKFHQFIFIFPEA